MSKAKLTHQLKKLNPELDHSVIETIVNVFSDSILKALKEDKSVEIRGLGRFKCKKLKENFNARNPATNELIYTPERVKVRFKASKNLNKLINE